LRKYVQTYFDASSPMTISTTFGSREATLVHSEVFSRGRCQASHNDSPTAYTSNRLLATTSLWLRSGNEAVASFSSFPWDRGPFDGLADAVCSRRICLERARLFEVWYFLYTSFTFPTQRDYAYYDDYENESNFRVFLHDGICLLSSNVPCVHCFYVERSTLEH
jgi:hypothetical protein